MKISELTNIGFDENEQILIYEDCDLSNNRFIYCGRLCNTPDHIAAADIMDIGAMSHHEAERRHLNKWGFTKISIDTDQLKELNK